MNEISQKHNLEKTDPYLYKKIQSILAEAAEADITKSDIEIDLGYEDDDDVWFEGRY